MWYAVKVLFFLTAVPFPSQFKVILLKLFGAEIGKGLVLKPRVNIHMPWHLKVGDDVWIGEEALLLNFELLTIGNNVCISQRVFLCCGNHDFRSETMRYRNAPITLEDGCWIGACSFIGPGVSIGVDTVIAAGSVASMSLPANAVFKGNPIAYSGQRWR